MANGTIHQTMGVPDYDNGYDVPALASAGGSFTVPSNGYMHFTFMKPLESSSLYYAELVKPNITYRDFAAYHVGANMPGRMAAIFPVAAGDVIHCVGSENITWTTTSYNWTYYPKFIPCK